MQQQEFWNALLPQMQSLVHAIESSCTVCTYMSVDIAKAFPKRTRIGARSHEWTLGEMGKISRRSSENKKDWTGACWELLMLVHAQLGLMSLNKDFEWWPANFHLWCGVSNENCERSSKIRTNAELLSILLYYRNGKENPS
jgi:hypothetical protein